MNHLIKKHAAKIRFILVGGTNTLIDFLLFLILTGLSVNKYLSNFASTSTAFVFSFFTNRNFTFKSKKSIKKQILPFVAVTLTGLWVLQPLVITIVTSLVQNLSESATLVLAKGLATAVTLVWNYTLYSKVVFKN